VRWLRHLLSNRWTLQRRFPSATLAAIEAAVAASETRHRGELRFAIESALDVPALWRGVQPRERALETFSELRVWDTREQNGVLIYMLLADHDVEIVADRGFDGRVQPAEWQEVCAGIERAFRAGRWQDGALLAVEGVTALAAREFPRTGAPDADELPNRPRIL
jgi:uncharacterized membrane protein